MKSINAEVAINTLFSILKAAIVNPLIAPPVPSNPAEKPDNEPPITALLLLSFMTNFFLIKNSILRPTRKMARIISSQVVSIYFDTTPPNITKRTEGRPIYKSNLLFKPFRKRKILLKLLDK